MALPLFFDFTDCRIMDFCRQKNVCSNYLHALLVSRPSEENKWSTTLHQYFLCLPLRGFTFHSCTKSFLEYRCSGIVATLYHHFNFALSLRPCSESNPMSPLTASLQVLDEHPRMRLAPPIITGSSVRVSNDRRC